MFRAARGRDDTLIGIYALGDPALSVRRQVSMANPTREESLLLSAATSVAEMVGKALRGREQSARSLASS